MASGKAKRREKRDRFTAEPSPELMEALDSIAMSNPNNCATCDYKRNPDGGWCYMFRYEPRDVCLKHTGLTFELRRSPRLHRSMKMEQRDQPGAVVSSEGLGAGAGATQLRLHTLTRKNHNRWFVKRGARTYFGRGGFRSKAEASEWIDSHRDALDWRVGYHFRLRGDTETTVIVNRMGEPASA